MTDAEKMRSLETDGYPLVEEQPAAGRPAVLRRRSSGSTVGMLWDELNRSLVASCVFSFFASAASLGVGALWLLSKSASDRAFALCAFPLYNTCLIVGCARLRKARLFALIGTSLAGAIVGLWFLRSFWMNTHPRVAWNPTWRDLLPLAVLVTGWVAAVPIVRWWPAGSRRVVYDGVRCVKCGYSLDGLPRGSTCPECGEPMADCPSDWMMRNRTHQ
jgi:hypothetical protein